MQHAQPSPVDQQYPREGAEARPSQQPQPPIYGEAPQAPVDQSQYQGQGYGEYEERLDEAANELATDFQQHQQSKWSMTSKTSRKIIERKAKNCDVEFSSLQAKTQKMLEDKREEIKEQKKWKLAKIDSVVQELRQSGMQYKKLNRLEVALNAAIVTPETKRSAGWLESIANAYQLDPEWFEDLFKRL